MPLIQCSDCAREMSDSAPACPHCGRPNRGVAPPTRAVGGRLAAGIVFLPQLFSWFTLREGYSVHARVFSFAWLLLSSLMLLANANQNSDGSAKAAGSVAAPQVAIVPRVEAPVQPPPPPAPVEPVQEAPADRLTRSQRNALRTATDYLQMSGFSRDGLIDQLSSSFGNGYSKEDATVAVDSLDADWNEQAKRAAAEYLQMQGFSCRELIGQLSSSYGNKFTKAQAAYGAKQAGACD